MQTSAEFLRLLRQRRSVRSFTPDRVDEASVRRLLDAAVLAPSAMDRQPWAFVVIQDRAILHRYGEQAKAMRLAADASADALERQRRAMLAEPGFDIFHDAGTLIVICRTQQSAFAEADCWLAAGNLMLAATAMGLASCCVGSAVAVLNTPAVRRELGIAPEGAAVAPIVVGMPKVQPEPVGRKAPQVLCWRPAQYSPS